MTVWTIGHSTHELERFLSLLARHDIDVLVDVRAGPHSRRHPHFEQVALERSLPERGVAYVHLSRLGGWRRPAPDSPNGGWRNRSFRGRPPGRRRRCRTAHRARRAHASAQPDAVRIGYRRGRDHVPQLDGERPFAQLIDGRSDGGRLDVVNARGGSCGGVPLGSTFAHGRLSMNQVTRCSHGVVRA